MANLVADVCNLALDACGNENMIGDISEGTREAQILLRAYGQCLRQMFRAVHWDFARKQADMFMLADASGQNSNVSNFVAAPWTYCYAYPDDCMKARFVPLNVSNTSIGIPAGNITLPNTTPFMANLGQQQSARLVPSRFLVGMDVNYPVAGISNEAQNVGPQGRTVIWSNVNQAQIVYTSLVLYPGQWDSLFRAAFVAYLAGEIALPLIRDKKMALTIANRQQAIVKSKVLAARIANGNEGITTTSHTPDWISVRKGGGGRGWGAWGDSGPGVTSYGYDMISMGDGGAF